MERMFVSTAIALVIMGYGLATAVMVVLSREPAVRDPLIYVCSRLIVKPSKEIRFRDIKADLKGATPFAINVALVSTLYSINGFLLLSIIGGLDGLSAARRPITSSLSPSI